jgi:hypothetical protein
MKFALLVGGLAVAAGVCAAPALADPTPTPTPEPGYTGNIQFTAPPGAAQDWDWDGDDNSITLSAN